MKIKAVLAGVLMAAGVAGVAHADYAFSGSGSSGNFAGQASEPFSVNFDHQFGGTQQDWGSPGVSAGLTPYLETQQAFGLVLTFTGAGLGAIDANSILIGNSAACAGSTNGGTTFCTIGSPDDIWVAKTTGPDTIEFLAQNSTFFLNQNQDYFVNVFFDGSAAPTAFTGTWLTEFSPAGPGVPEPATWSMMMVGIGALGGVLRSQRKAAMAAA